MPKRGKWGYIRDGSGRTIQALSVRKAAAKRKAQGRIRREK